ncbi:DNA repair photolyase [Paenibacillus polymyxa]
MGKILEFPADRVSKGVHAYTPEMGERKVNTQIEARLSHCGDHYFLNTKLELKGRGIKLLESENENNRYMVTWRAFDKLKETYSIGMKLYLD